MQKKYNLQKKKKNFKVKTQWEKQVEKMILRIYS
jgi:hypothetical protein